MTNRLRRLGAVLAASALAFGLAACTGDDGPDGDAETDPAGVLAAARATLEETSGVRLALTTADLPSGVTGVQSATGVGSSAPEFDGTITVLLGGNAVQVPVVAVDGDVYAELPFTSGYQRIDPAEYGAPDPARLLSTDGGLSEILTATTELDDRGQARNEDDPDEVLRTIAGTVDGSRVEAVIPSAEGDFDVLFEVADDEELRRVDLTGVFYPDTRPMTYRVTFSDYGIDTDVTAP